MFRWLKGIFRIGIAIPFDLVPNILYGHQTSSVVKYVSSLFPRRDVTQCAQHRTCPRSTLSTTARLCSTSLALFSFDHHSWCVRGAAYLLKVRHSMEGSWLPCLFWRPKLFQRCTAKYGRRTEAILPARVVVTRRLHSRRSAFQPHASYGRASVFWARDAKPSSSVLNLV